MKVLKLSVDGGYTLHYKMNADKDKVLIYELVKAIILEFIITF